MFARRKRAFRRGRAYRESRSRSGEPRYSCSIRELELGYSLVGKKPKYSGESTTGRRYRHKSRTGEGKSDHSVAVTTTL